MASAFMLEEDFKISIPLDRVYRMMDKLDAKAIEKLQDITYKNVSFFIWWKNKCSFF